jgi:hypothetical protein
VFSSHQLLTLLLNSIDLRLHPGGHCRGGELRASHAGHLQQALGLRTQARNLLRDQLLEARRHSTCHLLYFPLQLPPALALRQHAARHQIIDHVDHEQRIAIRAAMNCPGQLL